MTNARDKANIPVLNFQSKGIDDNADATAITIDSSERIGINNTSPSTKLHLDIGTDNVGLYQNSTDATSGFSLADNGGSINLATTSSGAFRVLVGGDANTSADNSSEAFRISSAGKVSIGTSTAEGILKLDNTGQTSETLLTLEDTGGSGAHTQIALKNTTGVVASILTTSDNLEFRVDDATVFSNISGSEHLRITSGGGVGIGTTSVINGEKLKVQGKIYINAPESNTAFTTGACLIFPETYNNIRQNTDHSLVFDTYNSGSVLTPLTIKQDGKIGIGTVSPSSPLTVSGGTNSTVVNINNTVSTTTSSSTMLLLQSGTSGSAGVGHGISIGFNAERNDGNNQRYGTLTWEANTNSGTSLKTDFVVTSYSGHEVLRLKQTSVGSQNEMIAPDLLTTGSTSNRYPLYWVHNGTVGSIQPYTGSVREMKTDINDMSSVDWIHSLRPRSFKFRDFETNEDGSKTYLETTNNEPSTEYGLIAEEVNEVSGSDYILDKQIDEDGNENLKGVLYHNLVPVLLKAVQEQKNTIQELEARITALETTTP
ncbi:tail fiber domain-containing protein [bacterium]|nr:tail fiber domain-containing protein [bacterium]